MAFDQLIPYLLSVYFFVLSMLLIIQGAWNFSHPFATLISSHVKYDLTLLFDLWHSHESRYQFMMRCPNRNSSGEMLVMNVWKTFKLLSKRRITAPERRIQTFMHLWTCYRRQYLRDYPAVWAYLCDILCMHLYMCMYVCMYVCMYMFCV